MLFSQQGMGLAVRRVLGHTASMRVSLASYRPPKSALLVMKQSLLALPLLSVFLGSYPTDTAGQTMIDQMVIDNMNTRRKEEIYKSRRTGTNPSRATGTRKVSGNAQSGTQRQTAPVYFGMDMYQQVVPGDPRGFAVQFVFTPTGAAPFFRKYNYVEAQGKRTAKFTDIPKGVYNVTAQAILSSGRKHRVHLGTELGGPSNPAGGHFAPSINVLVKPGKDYYGAGTLVAMPETIYIRVLD